MSFADDYRAALPGGLHLPDAFAAVFDWAEARGQRGRFTHGDQAQVSNAFLSIYPLDVLEEPGASHVLLRFDTAPIHDPPTEALERYATFAQAAGDGGTLGFWRDDDGRQRIVVFDHGVPYILTDDPLVALQFLAIGYPKPAALTDAGLTALQAAEAWGAEEPILPDGFRGFLTARFGVTIPARAADLGIAIPQPDDMSDPVRRWLADLMPADDAVQPGLSADNPLIIDSGTAAIIGPDGIARLRETIPFITVTE